MVEPDENYVKSMLSMGFADAALIRRALVIAKNDLNMAVGLLTDDSGNMELYEDTEMRDTETQHGSEDGDMEITNLDHNKVRDEGHVFEESSAEPPPSYDEVVNANSNQEEAETKENSNSGPMEFPTTHLYELEGRVFGESWSIPFKKEESLGRCLISSTRFAQEGLAEADESCKRFMDRALPECFKKLLMSQAVHQWGSHVQDGIYDMLCLLVDLIAQRLKYAPPPYGLLQVLTQAFDPDTEFQFKNRTRPWDKTYFEEVFGLDKCYAISPQNSYYSTDKDPYGWLVNIINRFAEKGGFEEIRKLIESEENVTAPMLASLLKPLGVCAAYLNVQVISVVFSNVFEKNLAYIQELSDEDMKQKEVGKVFDLLTTLKLLGLRLWHKEVPGVDELRLEVALKMLKTPHFNAKMNSLKEVCKLIDDSERHKSSKVSIPQETIFDWLLENKVLSVAFESNLHQSQYCDRLKVLVEFLGTRLSLDELTIIWKMQFGKHPTEVDNIHNIIATAAVRFNANQLDHLFILIQQSWGAESDRMKEKLLGLIGRIGKEARVGKITTKVLDLLWSLAHLPSLTTDMVDQALKSHIDILSDSFTVKEQIKKNYAVKCIEDIKKGVWIVPAIRQLLKITRGMIKQQYNKHDKGILPELNKTYDLIKLTTNSLVQCHQLSVSTALPSRVDEDTLLDGRYTHSDSLYIHLKYLGFVLQEADLYLPWSRTKDLWDVLVSNADCCEFDKETAFEWFTKGLCDLEPDTQSQIFNSKVLKLDPSKLTMKGFQCFKAFFESVNLNEHRLKKTSNTCTVEKMELLGMDYLWHIVLDVPSEEIAVLAIELLLKLSYTWLSPKLKKDALYIHKKFILECYKRLENIMSLLGHHMSVTNAASSVTKAATAPITHDVVMSPSLLRTNQLLSIERLLMIAEHYITTVEDLHAGPRTLLPHGASFQGYPITLMCKDL